MELDGKTAAAAPVAESKAQDPPTPAEAGAAAGNDREDAVDDKDHAPETANGSLTQAFSSLAVPGEGTGTVPAVPPSSDPSPVPLTAPKLSLRLSNDMVDSLDDAGAADLDINGDDFLSLLPPGILPRVDRLKALDGRREDLLAEYRHERAALERKFHDKMQPLYEERQGVVRGDFDGAISAEGAGTAAVGDGGDGAEEEEDVRGIPQFWACAMGHVDAIAELITEADVDCLDHLTDIQCADFTDGLGFELHFYFGPSNPFFTNRVLHKRYEVPNLLTEDEPILKNVTGTEIHWKPGRSLTFKQVTKKQRKKAGVDAGRIRTVTRKERTESFFHFFAPPRMPGLMDVVDEEEADAVEEAFDHDYDVAQAFRGHLVPRAVRWFTGEAMILNDLEEEAEEMATAMAAAEQRRRPEGAEDDAAGRRDGGGAGLSSQPAPKDGDSPEREQN